MHFAQRPDLMGEEDVPLCAGAAGGTGVDVAAGGVGGWGGPLAGGAGVTGGPHDELPALPPGCLRSEI